MTTPIESVAIVRFDEDGDMTIHVCGGEKFSLFVVDERAPDDRVYEWLPRCDAAEISAVLGDDPIGSSQDERHAAIAARINEVIDGTPRLRLVEDEE